MYKEVGMGFDRKRTRRNALWEDLGMSSASHWPFVTFLNIFTVAFSLSVNNPQETMFSN